MIREVEPSYLTRPQKARVPRGGHSGGFTSSKGGVKPRRQTETPHACSTQAASSFSMMKGRCASHLAGALRPPKGGKAEDMQPFRILEHTADVGFEALGSTREEVFVHAARALFSLIVELDEVDAREKALVAVAGADPESVLVNWLSELLYLHDAEGWLFREFEIRSLADDSLRAVAWGERFQRSRHHLKLLVKAITYHQLALEETHGGWRAQVYVDI